MAVVSGSSCPDTAVITPTVASYPQTYSKLLKDHINLKRDDQFHKKGTSKELCALQLQITTFLTIRNKMEVGPTI